VINVNRIASRLRDRNPRIRMLMRCRVLETILFMCCSNERFPVAVTPKSTYGKSFGEKWLSRQ
jgi:hypothetical protein